MELQYHKRTGLYRLTLPTRCPSSVPDAEFDEIFGRLPANSLVGGDRYSSVGRSLRPRARKVVESAWRKRTGSNPGTAPQADCNEKAT